jgi:uncharacterized protein (DUF488 family)
VEVYSIGFAQKTAEQFFGLLKSNGIRRLLDVRLNNSSQLAGFTKRDNLAYFLKEICGADYFHDPSLAPTQEMLDAYKKSKGSWDEYESSFRGLLVERRVEETLDRALFQVPTTLLCSEPSPEHCHRRLVLEYLSEKWGGVRVTHL